MRQQAVICALSLAILPLQAMAQSSVTLSGRLDAGVSFVSNQGGGRNTILDTGVNVPNLLFFNGSEDLGGGTKAVFELVSQLNLANGTTLPSGNSLFGRQAYVGLKNDRYGSFTMGNQYEFMHDSLLFGGFDSALTYGGFYTFRQGPFAALGVPNNPTGSSDFDRLAGISRVTNSVRYKSPEVGGFSFGVLYGFGGTAGDFSANSTASVGANYRIGALSLGAAYTDERYEQLNNGHDSIRNWGLGASYQIDQTTLNLLYTNTKNTLTGATIDVVQGGANCFVTPFVTIGASYEYMRGNDVLNNNYAHQATVVAQYWLSKQTNVYVQGVYQYANGDGGNATAWINGLYGPEAASSTHSQAIARVGMATRF
jgi:predicted porin